MLYILNSYLISVLLYWFNLAYFTGGLAGFALLYLARDKGRKEGFLTTFNKLIAIPFVLTLIACLGITIISLAGFGLLVTPNLTQLAIFCGLAIASLFTAVWFLRSGVAWIEEIKQRFTSTSAIERNKKTDVRNISDFLPEIIEAYNPITYFDLNKGVFLGLSEAGEPIYWPHGKDLPHVQVVGTTGSGKGVFLGMLIYQNIALHEAVFVIDPKDDEWLPHVVASGAKKYNQPYLFIDLRPTAPFQLNLFQGSTVEQIEEMFIGGFGLAEKGGDSDFYSIADRKAALDTAKFIFKHQCTAAYAFQELGKSLDHAPKFQGYLREMADISAVNATSGLDLREIVKNGGAAYVVGSMRNSKVIRLQKMLVIKLIHLAEGRDRTSNQKIRPISVILDEFIYHISKPVLEGLGAARDKGMHVTLAHQSIADFARATKELDKEAVRGAVIENCALKLVYRVEDPETAKWFAEKSGKIQVDDEARSVEKNIVLTERLDDKRMIRQTERNLIDTNMILTLHPSLGVIFGLGQAQFSFSSPVVVEKSRNNLVPKVFTGDAVESAEDALDVSLKRPSSYTDNNMEI